MRQSLARLNGIMLIYSLSLRIFLLLLLLLGAAPAALAQPKTPADFGYRHLTMRYQRDTVHILVLSRKGEELQRKPVFFFVQGSLPRPAILYDDKGPYRPIPIQLDLLLARCHLVIVGKPGIPLTGDVRQLGPGATYTDPRTHQPPQAYCQRNYLGYYVQRNTQVVHYLARQPWVQAADITAMGHSEGSTIVARMARGASQLRRVIYLSGSPLGRMLTQVSGARQENDSTAAEELFQRWAAVVAAPGASACQGDSNRLVASLSSRQSPLDDLLHSRIPVFVGYGTRDRSALLNDYLRLETIRAGKTNFSFHAYPGLEHNFFGFTNGQLDYDKAQWDRVARDFLAWMNATQ